MKQIHQNPDQSDIEDENEVIVVDQDTNKVSVKGESQESVFLIPYIERRLKRRQNVIILIVGQTGSGKSLSAISIALKLDPEFTVEKRVVFSTHEFIKTMNSPEMHIGSVLIYDDAGIGINARDWQQNTAKLFGKITQSFRYKQLITIITVPKMSFIEKQSRNLVHLLLKGTSTQGLFKPFYLIDNPFDPDKAWTKYPVITFSRRGRRKEVQITRVKFPMPPKDIVEEYETKKEKFMEAEYQKMQDQTDPDGNPIKVEETVIPNGFYAFICHKCGFVYTSSLIKGGGCPRCQSTKKTMLTPRKKRKNAITPDDALAISQGTDAIKEMVKTGNWEQATPETRGRPKKNTGVAGQVNDPDPPVDGNNDTRVSDQDPDGIDDPVN